MVINLVTAAFVGSVLPLIMTRMSIDPALAGGVVLTTVTDVVEQIREGDVAPLEEPEYYQFDIPTPKVAELWRRGSVVSSWLLDLTAAALQANPYVDQLQMKRLKRRKLQLKDAISRIESELIPDLNA